MTPTFSKVIEGTSYTMQVQKNTQLDAYVDSFITIIGDAQEDDGYLFTFRTVKAAKPHEWVGTKRWKKVEDLSHNLCNTGHLFETAVAYYQATGEKSLLNISIKNADLLVRDFGHGKEEKYPGHQVVEIGLARLYRITGKNVLLTKGESTKRQLNADVLLKSKQQVKTNPYYSWANRGPNDMMV